MAEMTPGALLQQLIVEKTRRVAATRNLSGYVAMWPEAVSEVKSRFPNLSAEQRAVLRGNVEFQIRLLSKRTGIAADRFTPALGAVARLLMS